MLEGRAGGGLAQPLRHRRGRRKAAAAPARPAPRRDRPRDTLSREPAARRGAGEAARITGPREWGEEGPFTVARSNPPQGAGTCQRGLVAQGQGWGFCQPWGQPGPCLTPLSVKKKKSEFFLLPTLNLPSFSVKPPDSVLWPQALLKRLALRLSPTVKSPRDSQRDQEFYCKDRGRGGPPLPSSSLSLKCSP